MLDVQGTLKKFGYDPTTLKRYSERAILITCDYCGISHQTRYATFQTNPKMTCGTTACRNKLTAKTCLEKYGVRHHLSAKEVKETRKKNNLAKYGVDHIAKVATIKKRMQEANLAAYAKKDEHGKSIVVEKIKQTHRQKYGVDFAINHPTIKEKAIAKNMASFGAANPFGNPEIARKAQEAKIAKYGNLHGGNYGKTQKEIALWLLEVSGKTFTSNYALLRGREIDLYNEDLKLGIEYCGLYWHTEDSKQKRDRNYHADKLKKLKEQGVRLITIFEDEWVYRKQQVKNFLCAVLRVHQTTIFARKCEVREIPVKEAKSFFEQYHIQGKNDLGMYFAGLYYQEELVATMSFGRHHRNSTQMTLDRFAVKTGIHLPGGASKLFKFLLNLTGVSRIISWSDNRWSDGNVYRQLGFTLESALPPDYSYVDFSHNCRRVSKQSQRKSKTGCPAHITEKEFNKFKDLHRIWDCGKLRWLFCK